MRLQGAQNIQSHISEVTGKVTIKVSSMPGVPMTSTNYSTHHPPGMVNASGAVGSGFDQGQPGYTTGTINPKIPVMTSRVSQSNEMPGQ